MANYTNVNRAKEATLAAGVVDTITFQDVAYQYAILEVASTADLYVRFDGVDPVVGGEGSTLIRKGEEVGRHLGGTKIVKVISAGAARYVVEQLR